MSKSKMDKREKSSNWRFLLSDIWTKIKDIVLYKSVKQIKEYFESSSINCYQYIVDFTMKKWERWMWRLVHTCALSVAIWVMWVAGGDAILTPVALSRTPTEAPLSMVEYPSVTLCSLNRISLNKSTEYANRIIENKNLSISVEELVKLMGFLGFVYDMELPNSDQLENLHSILDPYDLDVLMKYLSPTCEELLSKCLWRNSVVKCTEIFKMRKAQDGYCCTFNHHQLSNDSMSSNSTSKSNNSTIMAMPGQDRGLSILLDPQVEDYLFTKLPHEGIKILICSPGDFPDVPSGGCLQAVVIPITELYINLDAVLVTGTDDVRKLSIDTRGCLFDSDNITTVESQGACIVKCKVRSIRAACKCVPFFLPQEAGDVTCNLNDNICLQRWNENWVEAWSGEDSLLEPGQEAGVMRGPPCSNCLPACEESVYRSRQHSLNLQPDAVNSQPDAEKTTLKKGIVFVDHCAVHVFFSRDTVVHLEYGILSNWWDLLSSMGGLCGLVLGASLISVAEILYFIFGGPVSKTKHRRQAEMRQLYWEELKNYKRR